MALRRGVDTLGYVSWRTREQSEKIVILLSEEVELALLRNVLGWELRIWRS